jgi:hypothetical protein
MKLFSHKDLGNHPLQYCPLTMNHPVYFISTNFRCQYPHGYAVQLNHVHPTGSMWLASFLFWALNLSLDTCEHCVPLLFLCLHTQTNTHATWIRTHNALFRAPGRSTRLRPQSHVIGSRNLYLIMLIKRFCNAKYVWLWKVLELCLQFTLTVTEVAVFLMV